MPPVIFLGSLLLILAVDAAVTNLIEDLPFDLPFGDVKSYNSNRLVVANGLQGSAAVAMWKVDMDTSVFTVAMATTQSFVALGLNPSSPTMGGADIVACHHEYGSVVVRDYFANGYGTPVEDAVNDWITVSSGHTDGTTWCVVERPFLTCKTVEDYQIFDVDAAVSGLIAFGVDKSRADLHYHSMNRKFTKFVFNEEALAVEESLPNGKEILSEHIITSPISAVPHDSTGAEICSYHVLPEAMAGDGKKHVVSLVFDQPITEARDEGLTHHTILYGCPDLIQGATDGAIIDCSDMWKYCGNDWLAPGEIIRSNEGIPVGKDIVVATVLLRHFYNPQLVQNFKDQNRWKIYYTSQLRPLEPVTINLQTTYLDIPAGKQSVTRVYMPPECTQRVGKIHIEAVRHHMHDYGIAGRLRHIRGKQELAVIHDMESYSRGVSEGWIPTNRVVYPGDMLIYECVYDNTRDEPVVWGERREDEMCVVAIRTKGTNITNALSFIPGQPDPDNYLFYCTAPTYKNIHTPEIRINKTEFEARIAGIVPYKEPNCTSNGVVRKLVAPIWWSLTLLYCVLFL